MWKKPWQVETKNRHILWRESEAKPDEDEACKQNRSGEVNLLVGIEVGVDSRDCKEDCTNQAEYKAAACNCAR
jgi:hypothetical protein